MGLDRDKTTGSSPSKIAEDVKKALEGEESEVFVLVIDDEGISIMGNTHDYNSLFSATIKVLMSNGISPDQIADSMHEMRKMYNEKTKKRNNNLQTPLLFGNNLKTEA